MVGFGGDPGVHYQHFVIIINSILFNALKNEAAFKEFQEPIGHIIKQTNNFELLIDLEILQMGKKQLKQLKHNLL